MTSPLSFPLATDTSLDQLYKTARGIPATLREGESGSKIDQLDTLFHVQKRMQFEFAAVSLALKRRNGFTSKIVSEIR